MVFDAPAGVPGFDNVAVMHSAVEQRGGHLWLATNGRPIAKRKVPRNDDRVALVKLADQVEEQLPARAGERQITKLVETTTSRRDS